MFFRAVHDRCAVDLSALNLPISNTEAIDLLIRSGYVLVTVNLVALVRACIGTSEYRRGARLAEAPDVFDCSSLMKWVYAQRGIWIPRRTIQQRRCGEPVERDDLRAGDLVFTTGHINYYDDDPADGVGHVGLATGEGTVVHAANRRIGIVETEIDVFLRDVELRGIRRIVPRPDQVFTFQVPLKREIETSDDFRWIILQRL